MLICISGSLYGDTISKGFGRGAAFSSLSSTDLLCIDQNPAGLSFLPALSVGMYYSPDFPDYHLEESSFVEKQIGTYIALPLGPLGIYLEGIGHRSLEIGSENETGTKADGGGLGVSYKLLSGFSIGVYGNYRQLLNEQYIQSSAGLLYAVPMGIDFKYGFGVYQVNMGLSWQSNLIKIGDIESNWSVSPSLSVEFFHTGYLSMFYDNTIETSKDYTPIYWKHGFRMSIAGIVDLHGGVIGDDISDYNYGYAGIFLHLPISSIDITLFAAYSGKKIWKVEKDNLNEFSFGTSIRFNTFTADRLSFLDSGFKNSITPLDFMTPDGDGKGDFLKIRIYHKKIVKVKSWELLINRDDSIVAKIDSSKIKKSQSGLVPFPSTILWSGVNNKNKMVPDGSYELKLDAILHDGDDESWSLGSIEIAKSPMIFSASIKSKRIELRSSENINIKISNKSADIEKYNIKVIDSFENIVYSKVLTSEGEITTFNWDGNISGETPVNSGNYHIEILACSKEKKPRSIIISDIFFHNKKDILKLFIADTIFSPNYDKKKDELIIHPVVKSGVKLKEWSISIVSPGKKKKLKIWSGKDKIPEKIIWKDKNIKDGFYYITFKSELANGKIINAVSRRIVVDKKGPELGLTFMKISSSLDNGESIGLSQFNIKSRDISAIKSYKLSIFDPSGKLIYFYKGRSHIPVKIRWDGVTLNGMKIPAGKNCSAILEAEDVAGNISRSKKIKFLTGKIENFLFR